MASGTAYRYGSGPARSEADQRSVGVPYRPIPSHFEPWLPLLLLLLLLLVLLHCVSESRPLLFSDTGYYYYCCCNLCTICTAFCFILINCLILFRSLEFIPGPSKAANEETSRHQPSGLKHSVSLHFRVGKDGETLSRVAALSMLLAFHQFQ